MKLTFIVLGCNPSNEGKTFVWKLGTSTEVTIFGIKKTVVRTYYIGGMPSEVTKDTKFTEDMSRFDVVERPFEVVDEQTGEANTIMLKWLHVKVA
jgi:hypothetical protein